jgi:hypothetical protein
MSQIVYDNYKQNTCHALDQVGTHFDEWRGNAVVSEECVLNYFEDLQNKKAINTLDRILFIKKISPNQTLFPYWRSSYCEYSSQKFVKEACPKAVKVFFSVRWTASLLTSP